MKNKNSTQQFILDLIKTMCVFEGINIDENGILKIINKEKLHDVKFVEYRKVYQLYQAIVYIFSLDRKLEFNDILKINEIVEYKISKNAGEIEETIRKVSLFGGRKIIEVYHQDCFYIKQNFKSFINELESEHNIDNKIDLILDFFISEIIEQWFVDGNKRTALIVCNKLLLDYCGIYNKEFLVNIDYLSFFKHLGFVFLDCYGYSLPKDITLELKYETYTKQLIEFLKSELLKKIKNVFDLEIKEFQKLKSKFDYGIGLTEDEIYNLVCKIYVVG